MLFPLAGCWKNTCLRLDELSRLESKAAILPGALLSLQAIQDLVYACDDQGTLTSIYSGTYSARREQQLDLDEVPQASKVIAVGETAGFPH